MTVRVVTCAGGAPWEAALVRGLQRRELGVEVTRRCVDHGELLGVALRDRPRAVVLAAELPWLDRELVGTLHDAGVAVVAVESVTALRPLDRIGVTHRLAAPTSPDELARLLHGLGGDKRDVDAGPVRHVPEPLGSRGETGRLIAVWGGPGAPGRTTVAVQLALDAARAGEAALLVDGDAWAPVVAQLLGLREAPAATNAERLARDGWPQPLVSCLHDGPDGLHVLPGLPRADLWPEVRERSWREVLGAARATAAFTVVDTAAPIEEDEELAFDRVPYRRNVMTRVALGEADLIVMVVQGDPIGLRHAIFAHHQLRESLPHAAERVEVVVNRAPGSARRLQDISREVEQLTERAPVAFLPAEPAFARVVWEGRTLHDVAPRSRWLRELRAASLGVAA